MTSFVQPDCDEMERFAISPELNLSLLFNLAIVTIAIPILIKAFIYITTKQVFHTNTTLQVQVHLLALLLHSVGRLFLHSIDLFNYVRVWESACEIIPNFYRCLILRGFYNVGLALSSMCAVSLVLERLAATIYSESYEHCKTHWGYVLVGLQFLLASFYLCSMYFRASFQPGNFVLYYCQTIASSSGSIWYVLVPLYSVMIAQIIAIILFIILIWKSKKLRAVQDISLSKRFSLDQGIESIRALKLLVYCNAIVFAVLSIVTTTLHLNAGKLSKQRYIALVEAVHILPLYGICVSVLVHSRLHKIGQTKKEKLFQSITANPNIYFQQFQEQIK